MAAVNGSAISMTTAARFNVAVNARRGLKSVSFAPQRKPLWSRSAPMRLQVSCAATKETVEKVSAIVKKQLALPENASVTGESKFADLGADSLDTVEIVMEIETAFGVSVEEENAQSIATVQDAADMIENLLEGKTA